VVSLIDLHFVLDVYKSLCRIQQPRKRLERVLIFRLSRFALRGFFIGYSRVLKLSLVPWYKTVGRPSRSRTPLHYQAESWGLPTALVTSLFRTSCTTLASLHLLATASPITSKTVQNFLDLDMLSHLCCYMLGGQFQLGWCYLELLIAPISQSQFKSRLMSAKHPNLLAYWYNRNPRFWSHACILLKIRVWVVWCIPFGFIKYLPSFFCSLFCLRHALSIASSHWL